MKAELKHIVVLLFTVLVLAITASAAEYKLTTAADFRTYASKIAAGDKELAAADYTLTAHIDFADTEFLPFGTVDTPFTGTFDGRGFSMLHVAYSTEESFCGVFAVAENAYIHDLSVVDASMSAKVNGPVNAGVLVGQYRKTTVDDCVAVERCFVSGTLTTTDLTKQSDMVGGLVGALLAEEKDAVVRVYDCMTDVDVSAIGGTSVTVGGIAGYAGYTTRYADMDISRVITKGNLYAEATVSASVGGMIGFCVEDDRIRIKHPEEDAELLAADKHVMLHECFSLCETSVKGVVERVSPTIAKSSGDATVGCSSLFHDSPASAASLLGEEDFLSDTLGLDLDNVWALKVGAVMPELRHQPYANLTAAYYEIATADDFLTCAAKIADGDASYAAAAYTLTNSLDFLGCDFIPFGTAENPFTGEFDGGGYSMNGIAFTADQKVTGVFGTAENAYIHDLAIVDCEITGTENVSYAGMLVGRYTKTDTDAEGCIERCFLSGRLTVQSAKYKTVYAGGAVGYLSAAEYRTSVSIADVYTDVDIRVSGGSDAKIGGIAGYAGFSRSQSSAMLHRLIARGSLYAEASVDTYAGGLVGILHNDKGWIWTGSVNNPGQAVLSEDAAGDDIRGCFCLCTIDAVSNIVRVSPSVADSNEPCTKHDVYYDSRIAGEYGEDDIKTDAAVLADTGFLTDQLGLDLDAVWTLSDGAGIPVPRRKTTILAGAPSFGDGTVSVRTIVNGVPRGTLVAAAYDEDGRLIGVKTETVINDLAQTVSVPCAGDPAAVKLYALDGFTPLCENIVECSDS